MTQASDTKYAERTIRAFFDEAPIGIAVTASDGSWQVNPLLSAMLGFSVEELGAISSFALTHPEDLAATHDATRRLLARECTTCVLERRLRAKDGNYMWFLVTETLLQDPGGTEQFTTYFLDIAEQKKRDAALRGSEERYRRLFEAAQDGVLILDAETGRVVDSNPFMSKLTGYARDELMGAHLWELGPFTDVADSKAAFAKLQAQDYVRYEDLPLRARDGREVAVEFISNVYLVGGSRVIQCNVRDVTLRKRAEEKLRMRERAIEAVSQGIVITDAEPDYPIVYASPGFCRLTGYEREEILGRNCKFLQGASTEKEPVALLRRAIREGKPCSVELLNFRKDGTPFWNSLAISPIKDAAGRVTSFVGVQTDVTARRRVESQLFQAQKMEAVGRLAGGIAHDFNNVLSVILCYAEMIGADLQLDEPLRAEVEEIRTAALRATELTRHLLAFSRQQVLETKVLSLNRILGKMEKMLGRLLGADIDVTMLPASGLGNIRVDPGQMEQVIMNLAINARDAMPQGGKLTIETTNVHLDEDYAGGHHDVKPGAYVMLAVSDSGVGMDKETLARIFEPFFTTKEAGKGTGLGLATVFGIVKQSGGHIFVYSEPEKGSTFKIYFPIVQSAVDPEPAPLSELEREEGVGTILLVEDEDQVRILARTILRSEGYVVLDAPNGGEALLICEQHGGNIDLLLTDVVLPRMSGRVLAERLAPLRPNMKVLYMSGYTDDAILQHGILDSGLAFLQKPFTPTTMVRKVREALRAGSGVSLPTRSPLPGSG